MTCECLRGLAESKIQWFSKCGPLTSSSFNITCELIRNANCLAPLQT